jgi:amidase
MEPVQVPTKAAWCRNERSSASPDREDFEPMTWAAIERGRRLTAASLAAATRDAARVSYALAQLREVRRDSYANARRCAAARRGVADRRRHRQAFRAYVGARPYAALANAAGLPAISVPQGLDTAGLPLAIQIVGPIGSDILLLQLARFFERSAPLSLPLHRLPLLSARLQ